jgi:hypothetical protein
VKEARHKNGVEFHLYQRSRIGKCIEIEGRLMISGRRGRRKED